MIKLLLLLLIVVLVGCTNGCNNDATDNAPKKMMDMKAFEEDLIVPSGLWKAMEAIYRPLALDAEGQSVKAEEEGKEGKEGEKPKQKEAEKDKDKEDLLKKRPPLDPISIHVYLVEKTPGVLGGQNYDLKYPIGGGVLDYRYFVPETRNGTFYVKVIYDKEMDPKETRIYYLSNAKIREMDDKPIGNGCSRYFDITDYWKKSMNNEGLELNTVGNRHISVTAGVLFFVSPHQGKLRIAHLTIKDGRHRELLCGVDQE
jgi:hypothetical protein